MNPQQAIDLYIQLTSDVHAYWVAFGALTVLILGWLVTVKTILRYNQRIALTIGWFASSGYLGASLMNRYRLLNALARDIQKLDTDLEIIKVVGDLGPIYKHYETLVWTSYGLISLGILTLIWSNVTYQGHSDTLEEKQ